MMVVAREKCFVCGSLTTFWSIEGVTLLREAICSVCGASIRNSDMAKVIVGVFTGENASLAGSLNRLNNIKILEAAADGQLHCLLKELPGYVCFEYFDDIPPGQMKGGVLCNNFENLTFSSESFDLVISQDVLEHVAMPLLALQEINRVLKPGGYHIFTVPLHEGRQTLKREGLPPVYHGDPLRKEGALVYTDWGEDICAIVNNCGMETYKIDGHRFYKPNEVTNVDKSYTEYLTKEPLRYYRYNSIIFVARKKVRCIFNN